MRERRRSSQDELEGWQLLLWSYRSQLGVERDDQDERRAAECWPDDRAEDPYQVEQGHAPHRQ